jgi:microcystin-dependent protein
MNTKNIFLAIGLLLISILVIVGIIYLLSTLSKKSSKDTYSNKDCNNQSKETKESYSSQSSQIIENFPNTSILNLLYTDGNGNLGATSDIGIKYLTVSTDSQINGNQTVSGNQTVGGTINATTISQGGNVLIPRGIIVMWNGNTDNIPAGWALCNGNNGTPNLSGRFIVGVGNNGTNNYTANQTGGSDSVILTIDQIPSHSHSVASPGNIRQSGNNTCDSGNSISCSDGSTTRETTSKGNNESHENRPSYYALCYIMKL